MYIKYMCIEISVSGSTVLVSVISVIVLVKDVLSGLVILWCCISKHSATCKTPSGLSVTEIFKSLNSVLNSNP